MLELLFYTTLSCPDADAIMNRIRRHEYLSNSLKIELIETVKDSVPECKWDAND